MRRGSGLVEEMVMVTLENLGRGKELTRHSMSVTALFRDEDVGDKGKKYKVEKEKF